MASAASGVIDGFGQAQRKEHEGLVGGCFAITVVLIETL